MPPRTRRTEPAADEAQSAVHEGEVVEEPAATEPVNAKMAAFQAALKASEQTISARLRGEIAEVKNEVGNLAALLANGSPIDAVGANELDTRLKALEEAADLRGFQQWREGVESILEKDEQQRIAFEGVLGEHLEIVKHVVERLDEDEQAIANLIEHGPSRELPPRQAAPPAVLKQVLELMRVVTEIGKERRADYGERYSFRGIDDAMDAVGNGMRKVGLIMRQEVLEQTYERSETPKFRNGKPDGVNLWTTTRVKMRYIFVSPIDGSEHALEAVGVGRDNADKDGSKALSAAMKYALFQGLCIPVQGMNIDPESDNPVPAEPARQQPPTQDRHPGAQQTARPRAEAGPEADPYTGPEPADDDPWSGPPPEGTPEHMQQRELPEADPKVERAMAALRAARTPGMTLGSLNKILAQAKQEGLLRVTVQGEQLQSWLGSIAQTVGNG